MNTPVPNTTANNIGQQRSTQPIGASKLDANGKRKRATKYPIPLHLSITPEMNRQLARVAADMEIPEASIGRIALKKYLQAHDPGE